MLYNKGKTIPYHDEDSYDYATNLAHQTINTMKSHSIFLYLKLILKKS